MACSDLMRSLDTQRLNSVFFGCVRSSALYGATTHVWIWLNEDMREPRIGLRGFTNRVSRVTPDPLASCKKGLVVFCKLRLLSRSSIMCAAGVTVGKINDSEIREGNDLHAIDRSERYRNISRWEREAYLHVEQVSTLPVKVAFAKPIWSTGKGD